MIKSIAVVLSLVLLSGCISLKSYVDPKYAKASKTDIKAVKQAYNTKVEIEFQRNGKHIERTDKVIRELVEQTLRSTRVLNPSTSNESVTLKVVMNNIADMGQAAAKGFGTGLTFGLAGSAVTDYYEFTVSYTDVWGVELSKSYKHALHSTVGNKAAPIQGVKAVTPKEAVSTVVEQVIVNFIVELQAKGMLSQSGPIDLFGSRIDPDRPQTLALSGLLVH